MKQSTMLSPKPRTDRPYRRLLPAADLGRALDDRQAAADTLIAQQGGVALLRASLNSHRAERERLLQRLAQTAAIGTTHD
jgi:hypothetical protein